MVLAPQLACSIMHQCCFSCHKKSQLKEYSVGRPQYVSVASAMALSRMSFDLHHELSYPRISSLMTLLDPPSCVLLGSSQQITHMCTYTYIWLKGRQAALQVAQGQESAGGDEWDWADDLWVSSPAEPSSSRSSGRQQPQEPQLQRARQPQILPAPELIFAEPALSQFLDMPSQVSGDQRSAGTP